MLCIYIVLLDSFFLPFFGSYKVLICVLFSTCSVSWMKIGISCWSLNRAPVWILINVKECQVIFYEVRLYFFFVRPSCIKFSLLVLCESTHNCFKHDKFELNVFKNTGNILAMKIKFKKMVCGPCDLSDYHKKYIWFPQRLDRLVG